MASVTATAANNTGTTTYRVYSWVDGVKGALIASNTSVPVTFTPLVGSHQYVLETTDSLGCVVTSTPQTLDCTVGLAHLDMIFGLGDVSSVCSTNTLILNMFDFRIVDEDVTSSQLNQQSNIGNGTDKVIPNGVTIANGYVVAPAAYSCGGSAAQAFIRFGFAINKLLAAYPAKSVFSFKLYGKKVTGKNVPSDNFFRISNNYFSTVCNYAATPVVNGVDFTRIGTCTALGIALLPGPTTAERYEMIDDFTVFTNLGTVTINTTTNEISFTKSSNLV